MLNLITKKELNKIISDLLENLVFVLNQYLKFVVPLIHNQGQKIASLEKEIAILKGNTVVFAEDTERYIPLCAGKKIHLLDVDGNFVREIRVENHEYNVAKQTKSGKIKFLKEVVNVTYE